MNKSESIAKLAMALSKFQGEIRNPENSCSISINSSFKYKYAPLNEILNLVRPILSKYGLSMLQMPINAENGVGVTTMLIHESGEYIESDPIILKMDKQNAQGAGSCITYARRYSLSAVLGISSEDDDDANSISHPPKSNGKSMGNSDKISDGQLKRLKVLCNNRFDEAKTIISKYGYESSKDILKSDYEKICGEISAMSGKK